MSIEACDRNYQSNKLSCLSFKLAVCNRPIWKSPTNASDTEAIMKAA